MEAYISLTEKHLKSNFEKYERTQRLGEMADSMLNSTEVFRLNFCAKNPLLRQAAKRYGSF
jgi:hypothetical protein